MSIVLVIAAHPDDEVLGCGATMVRHVCLGDTVHVVILVEGITSRDNERNAKDRSSELSGLAKAAHRANEILGVSSVTMHQFPDNRMDSVDLLDIIKVIESHMENLRPDIVYTHHAGDVNIDHQRTHQAVITACRQTPFSSIKQMLFFEVASSTEWQPPGSAPAFVPNWFNDVSDTLILKLKALEAYSSEMRPWPHVRSIQALEYLARWRGATVGVDAAEAFILGRLVSEPVSPEAFRTQLDKLAQNVGRLMI